MWVTIKMVVKNETSMGSWDLLASVRPDEPAGLDG